MAALLKRDAVLVRRDAAPGLKPLPSAPAPARADAPAAEPLPACTGCGATQCQDGTCCEACSHGTRAEAPAAAPAAPAPAPEPAKAAPAPTSRLRTFVASDESVDRYNTVIKASGWQLENFRRNPVILLRHDKWSWPIGKGQARVVGQQLLLDVDFFTAELNPEAERALQMIDAGVMGVSVGFLPIAYEYNKDREAEDPWENLWDPPLDYTAMDLLEVSVVTIGGNANAVPVGRDAPEAATPPEQRKVPIQALSRVVPELVRDTLNEVLAEVRAERTRRSGRIS